jgi:hypothetical protein
VTYPYQQSNKSSSFHNGREDFLLPKRLSAFDEAIKIVCSKRSVLGNHDSRGQALICCIERPAVLACTYVRNPITRLNSSGCYVYHLLNIQNSVFSSHSALLDLD